MKGITSTNKGLKEDIGKEVLRTANRLLFYPQPGPQTDLLAFKAVPEVLFGGARGGGKGLCLSTEVMTKDGWSTIGELKVGDTIFDADGRPTVVLYKSEPTLRACYRLTFDNGQQIIADDVHRWITHTKAERVSNYKCTDEYRTKRRANRPSRAKVNPINKGSQRAVVEQNKARRYRYKEPNNGAMRSTQDIFETLKVQNGREVNHAIRLAGFVEQPERELPIPPYILGLWLGDGSADSGRLTIGEEDAKQITGQIERCGYQWSRYEGDIAYKIWRDRPFVSELKTLGLIGNKLIPEMYLRACNEQRLELLQGLFDTDGSCNKDGQVEFCNTNHSLAQGVYELLASLGAKPFITTKIPLCTNGKSGPVRGAKAWIVKATTTLPVFRLQRKKERLPTKLRETQRWHYITKVEPIEPVWTQCLTVDSQTHTFLVSKAYIATHNTAALLGDFVSDVPVYKSHWIGVLFRRTYPELEEVIRQSFEFYPQTGATYNANEKMWKWGNGAKLYLRYIAHPRDATNYQGHQFCLEKSEKVVTLTGEKEIQDLLPGELVMTGSGYSRVLAVMAPVDKHCVQVTKKDGSSQVHPIDHSILCDSGWQSYSSLTGIDSKEIEAKFQGSCTLPSVSVHAVCLRRDSLVLKSEEATSTQSDGFYKSKQSSEGSILRVLKRFLGKYLDWRRKLTPDSQSLGRRFWPFSLHVPSCDRCDSPLTLNSLSGYQLYPRLCDECLRLGKDSAQDGPPSLIDVEAPLPLDSVEGAQGNIQLNSRFHFSTYPHPYVELELPMVWENSLEACEITYVGVKTCVDIHVEQVNNYITAKTGILNKNCWIGFDELGNFATDEGYQKLIATLRSRHNVPLKRIRATANPGGIGHGWVKDRFQIGDHPEGYKIIETESGLNRMFIPSRVKDNLILLKNDPSYVERLKEVGSAEMVRAWLYGDWDVVAGAYFPEFSPEHVTDSIDVVDIPNHWKIYRAYDHGTYHPFCVLWYTFAGEDWKGIKKGTIVILREWYGGNDKGEGFKMSLVDVRDGIAQREATFNRKVEPGPADNQIFENHGGQSIADAFAVAGIYFARSDKARIPGWNQVRVRLKEFSVLIARNCKHLIRTLPMLQHDESKPEDVDTRGDDHASDVLRYICMVWPVIPKFHRNAIKGKNGNVATWAELVEATDDITTRWRL